MRIMHQEIGIQIQQQAMQPGQQRRIGERCDITITENTGIARRGFLAGATTIDQGNLVTTPL